MLIAFLIITLSSTLNIPLNSHDCDKMPCLFLKTVYLTLVCNIHKVICEYNQAAMGNYHMGILYNSISSLEIKIDAELDSFNGLFSSGTFQLQSKSALSYKLGIDEVREVHVKLKDFQILIKCMKSNIIRNVPLSPIYYLKLLCCDYCSNKFKFI